MVQTIPADLIKTAIGLFFDVLDILISILPAAPFRAMLSQLSNSSGINVLGYVNYFIPFKFCATCLNTWLGCILTYYIYKYLRQAINDYRNSHKS